MQIQDGPKIGTIILYALTLPNIHRFSKLFHYRNQEKICNNIITSRVSLHYLVIKCLKSNNCKEDDICNNAVRNRKQRVYCLIYCLK